MRKVILVLVGMIVICLIRTPLLANVAEPNMYASAGAFLKSMTFQKGIVELPNGVALLDVPENFRYIGPDDSQRFLEEGWGNQNGSNQIGMLLPMDADPFGDHAWAVVISYREDGYISDKDAGKIDYDELLNSMQVSTKENNKQRSELGFPPMTLVGWAAKPYYDDNTKKLFWAKELQSGNNPHRTLNYNVRLLGRKGVLVMNAVSGMDQLPEVRKRMEQVIAFANFCEGHRYSDFNPGVDRVAAYGIAALIGGKMATESGLLAKIGGRLIAFKKYIIFGCIALIGVITQLLNRRKAESAA